MLHLLHGCYQNGRLISMGQIIESVIKLNKRFRVVNNLYVDN